jgi:hypothetical protein
MNCPAVIMDTQNSKWSPRRVRLFCFSVALFMLIPGVSLHADLDAFKDYIEAAESAPKEESPSGENEDNGFSEFLFKIFIMLWYYNNNYLSYAAHPYDGAGYIRRPWTKHPEVMDYFPEEEEEKNYWLSTSLSSMYMRGMGAGPWFSFSGNLYKFIGPYADAWLLTDREDILNGIRLGMHFSLLQFNGFNMSLYGQWQLWYGLMVRHAGVFGVEFRLYPVKPLSLRVKLGIQSFEYFSFGEAEFEAGFMIRAWEIFGGYRTWGFLDEDLASPGYPWSGPYLGVRRYF